MVHGWCSTCSWPSKKTTDECVERMSYNTSSRRLWVVFDHCAGPRHAVSSVGASRFDTRRRRPYQTDEPRLRVNASPPFPAATPSIQSLPCRRCPGVRRCVLGGHPDVGAVPPEVTDRRIGRLTKTLTPTSAICHADVFSFPRRIYTNVAAQVELWWEISTCAQNAVFLNVRHFVLYRWNCLNYCPYVFIFSVCRIFALGVFMPRFVCSFVCCCYFYF